MNKKEKEIVEKYISILKDKIMERVSGDLRKVFFYLTASALLDLEKNLSKKEENKDESTNK